jgi:hypothetical protein
MPSRGFSRGISTDADASFRMKSPCPARSLLPTSA